MREYIYLGDRFTDPQFKGKECQAVRRQDREKRQHVGNIRGPAGGCDCQIITQNKVKTLLGGLSISSGFARGFSI